MRSVFALFSEFDKAKGVVSSLLNRDISIKEINAVVQNAKARLNLDIKHPELKAEVSSYPGKTSLEGLERLLTGIRPVNTQDTGTILAAGVAGSILGKAAQISADKNTNSLQRALVSFGFPQRTAALYRENIATGQIMLWIRSPDRRVPEIVNVINDYEGHDIITIQ